MAKPRYMDGWDGRMGEKEDEGSYGEVEPENLIEGQEEDEGKKKKKEEILGEEESRDPVRLKQTRHCICGGPYVMSSWVGAKANEAPDGRRQARGEEREEESIIMEWRHQINKFILSEGLEYHEGGNGEVKKAAGLHLKLKVLARVRSERGLGEARRGED
ncbi:hypothetical protein B0F90DRAFT_1667993 [Multifurca ochricompacta]|uniref:Uncharacterized protein n=1 Tax=Multifurca ochricompacta TaxID=376703 RepID=A0AAD4QNK7_9AGAM|nr:hypothetical protein B0F90DRAFT_1667993 [Multifurca ochricompacta]